MSVLLISTFAVLLISPSSIVAWWRPAPRTTWQWQINGARINTSFNVTMYDIDLDAAPQATIDLLHRQGRTVICYFCAGTFENYREDAASFPREVIGRTDPNWPEQWLDIRSNALKPVMLARLNKAVAKKCDGVEPDTVDGYQADTGFNITRQDQVTYLKWISAEAHQRNLSVGLKNVPELIPDLITYFDWALVESCRQFNECDNWDAFVAARKAVFGVEYRKSQRPSRFCPAMNAKGFSWLKKLVDLDARRADCLDPSTWNNL